MGSVLLSTFPQPSGTKGENYLTNTQSFYSKFQNKLSQIIDTFRKAGYRQGEASDLNNLANILSDNGKVDEALLLHTQALAIALELNSVELKIRILAARGDNFWKLA